MSSPIREEATKWSELPNFIEQYNSLVQHEGDGVSRIFGYASIIGNHSAEKPQDSNGLPNEKARVEGMEVAMNVYATGQYEFRGTRDLENGVFNVGLYAGMEPSLTEEGFSEGLNITVAPQNSAQSFAAYMKREIGAPPGGQSMEELLVQGENGRIELSEQGKAVCKDLQGTPEDEFGLYKLQVVDSKKEDGASVPALTVSTNENSEFSAIGLSPKQAAHYILDGQGYTREVDGRPLGGSAIDYFKSALEGYEEHGLQQPRISAIASEVVAMAEAERDFTQASKSGASTKELAEVASRALEPEVIGGEKYFLSSVTARKFGEKDLVERGSPTEEVRGANNLPKTAAEKASRIVDMLDKGDLDKLKGISANLKASGASAPQEGIASSRNTTGVAQEQSRSR